MSAEAQERLIQAQVVLCEAKALFGGGRNFKIGRGAREVYALLNLPQVVPCEAVAIFDIQAQDFLGRKFVLFLLHQFQYLRQYFLRLILDPTD